MRQPVPETEPSALPRGCGLHLTSPAEVGRGGGHAPQALDRPEADSPRTREASTPQPSLCPSRPHTRTQPVSGPKGPRTSCSRPDTHQPCSGTLCVLPSGEAHPLPQTGLLWRSVTRGARFPLKGPLPRVMPDSWHLRGRMWGPAEPQPSSPRHAPKAGGQRRPIEFSPCAHSAWHLHVGSAGRCSAVGQMMQVRA